MPGATHAGGELGDLISRAAPHMLDPDDPWPLGYRVSDTWPKDKEPAA
jgi:hypothetical protein